jgi:hypothetical protein
MQPPRTAADWFHLAERAYSERHQACAWCGGAYRVHLARRGAKHTFRCQQCDFQVTFDAQNDNYHLVPGEDLSGVSETMQEQPIADLLRK